MSKSIDTPAPLFEIQHGDAVVRIADDWSGHVLIEQIYAGLRQARRSRDKGQVPVLPPPLGTQAANDIIEAAEAHGFQQIEGSEGYRASAEQIVALVTAMHDKGAKAALSDRES